MSRHSKKTTKENARALAKITRPVLAARVYERTRLFRLMDQARKRPIVWLVGPAGAGKTTLVASYLRARGFSSCWYQIDSSDDDIASFFYYMGRAAKAAAPRHQGDLPLFTLEYSAGLATFAVNYFRDFFARLKPPGFLVLDNFQEASSDGPLQDALYMGLRQMPAKTNVIIISRQEPPPAFARARVSDISLLGWEALKLTEEESRGIVKLRQKRAVPRDAVHRLHHRTQGWAAGLVLLSEQIGKEATAFPQPSEPASQSVFDYFANEVLRRSSPTIRQFLLKTSLLPTISVGLAQGLTEERHSESILRDLTRRNYFTVRRADGTYEYHPLFRAFLAKTATDTYTADEIKGLKQRCARFLAEKGDVETAVSLLEEAQDWHEAVALILKHARVLAEQGRTRTLEAWFRALPSFVRTKNPYVLFWLGVCRLYFSPAEARTYFEQAFAIFEKHSDDASPLYLTWSKIVESYLLEFNDFTPILEWTDRYPHLKDGRKPPTEGVENASLFTCISGLVNARFDHPELDSYVKRAEQLLEADVVVERRLAGAAVVIPYHLWRGDVSEVGKLLEYFAPRQEASDSRALVRINWCMWKALYAGTIGAAEESVDAVSEGLAVATTTGIHVLDSQLLGYGIMGQLCVGNIEAAREMLRRMHAAKVNGRGQEAFYLHNASMIAVHDGDITGAIDMGRRSVELAKASGLYVGTVAYALGLSYAYICQGDVDTALSLVAEIRPKAIAMGSNYFLLSCDFCEIMARRLRGEKAASIEALHRGLALANETGIMVQVWSREEHTALVYTTALEAEVHVDYARTVIRKLQLSPPAGVVLELWPWSVRVYALGNFTVLKNDVPIAMDGRVQKKPLELLHAIIALGGRDIPLGKLMQILWPDMGGDAAKVAFETTLHQLRRMLGEKCVVMQQRQLSLDDRYCWLDAWAFERFPQLSEANMQPLEMAERIFHLYQGPFLGNKDVPEVLAVRGRLREKFLRLLSDIGNALEAAGNQEAALQLYEKGIEIDPLTEELYVRLIHCYRRLDRPAEALAIYQRSQQVFSTARQIDPTGEMKWLQQEMSQTLVEDDKPNVRTSPRRGKNKKR